MTKREYLDTIDVKKLVRNGLLPVTIMRDMAIFDAVFAFQIAFDRGTMTKGDAVAGVALSHHIAERTVRKAIREMRADIV